MVFNYMNFRKHPDDRSKMVFYYIYEDVYIAMQEFCAEKQIPFETQMEESRQSTYYVIVPEGWADAARSANDKALLKHKKPFLPDPVSRWTLIILLLVGTAIALTGYIVTRFF